MSTPLVDPVVPLVSTAQMRAGAFADLVRNYSDPTLATVLSQATRACETESTRRFSPFTLTESIRASGVDPDEYGDTADLPLDMAGALGRSYAAALGGGNGGLIRHVWLAEYAPLFPDLWTYSNVSITLVRSYGGAQQITAAGIVGPEPDTGHLWFNMGTYLPLGSLVRVTYSGGYTTTPADLARACMYMAAAIVARELDPMAQSHGHSPDALEALAVSWLRPYARAG